MNINIGGTKKWESVSEHIRPNWKVLDIAGHPDFKYDLNSGDPFPFKDGSINSIFTSHTLEHVQLLILPHVLKEIYRVLNRKGIIRVVVPDVQLAIKAYAAYNKEWLKTKGKFSNHLRGAYPETMLGHLMTWFYSTTKSKPGTQSKRSGHNMVFDWESLVWFFKQAGFTRIVRMKYGKSSPVFDGLDFSRHKDTSLYMEARK
jgi:predicted SAM-dependent methyltransferase